MQRMTQSNDGLIKNGQKKGWGMVGTLGKRKTGWMDGWKTG